MGKHTPGPWKCDERPHFGAWFVRQDPVNWNGMGYQLICDCPAEKKGTHYGDMFKANARLIAAAPDMLDALRLIAGEDGLCVTDGTIAAARAAIAKAEGKP